MEANNRQYNKVMTQFHLFSDSKLDVIIGCGTNPKRPLKGEPCKALVKINGDFLVYPIIKTWASLPDIGIIYLAGPKGRLEKELVPLLRETGIENYIIVDEPSPGDANAIINNVVEVCTNHRLSRYAIYSTCDIVKFDKEKAKIILDDIINAMVDDNEKKKFSDRCFADLYFTAGYQTEDISCFGKIDHHERSGVPFSSNEILRMGCVHLFNTQELKGAKQMIELLSFRKWAHQWMDGIRYCWPRLGHGAPWYKLTEERKTVLKAAVNYVRRFGITIGSHRLNRMLQKVGLEIKKPKIHIPLERLVGGTKIPYLNKEIPYFTIPLASVERAGYEFTGLYSTIVKTKGTDDIDFDSELEAVVRLSRLDSSRLR